MLPEATTKNRRIRDLVGVVHQHIQAPLLFAYLFEQRAHCLVVVVVERHGNAGTTKRSNAGGSRLDGSLRGGCIETLAATSNVDGGARLAETLGHTSPHAATATRNLRNLSA